MQTMMKGLRTPAVLMCIFILSLFSFAAAEDTKEEKGTISVTGQAREYVPPDTAVITLAVETTGKTADDAVAANSTRAEAVVNALKRLITPEQGDSVKTSSYSVQPVYDYDSMKKKSILTGYRANHQVTVRTKRIEGAGKLIDSAIQAGANKVQNISFILQDEKSYCDRVLKKAAEEAKKEATFVAQTLGVNISGIKSIAPSCGSETFHPVLRQAYAESKAAAAPETPIEVGDIAVNASVSIVFYLGQK